MKPATFELMMLSERGILTAKTAPRARPVSLPRRLSSSSFQTSIMPIREVRVLNIIMRIRVWGTKVAMPAVRMRKTTWAPPRGICMRRERIWEKPKPLMMIEEN